MPHFRTPSAVFVVLDVLDRPVSLCFRTLYVGDAVAHLDSCGSILVFTVSVCDYIPGNVYLSLG